jgi:hypothetical protein
MALNHILQRFEAGAALGFVAAGAGGIDLGHAAFFAVIAGQVLADLFVAERVAQANHHGVIPLGETWE